MGAQKLSLYQRVWCAIGKRGRRIFGAFGITEKVGAVGTLVDGPAPQFRKPKGLALSHPGRRRRISHPPDPVVVRVTPPVHQVLVAPDPGFVMGPIGDGCACPGGPVSIGGIIPIVPLAPGDVGTQIADLLGIAGDIGIRLIAGAAPVGKGHVIVDTDSVDVRTGP